MFQEDNWCPVGAKQKNVTPAGLESRSWFGELIKLTQTE